MSANPIVYCLEQLTDYRQFERLCSDLMAGSGYPNIEPLGGSNDRGRDALHMSRTDPDDVSIFAYTVRADWRQKLLNEDCERILEEGHSARRLVFVCASTISATQKDQLREAIQEKLGWEFDTYDLERIRTLLAGPLRHLIAQHSSIFCPPWFPHRGGLSISECRDTLVIDHVKADHALATWLARRLQRLGYRTWCFGTAPLAGENADESVRTLIGSRAAQYLLILSQSAVDDPDLLGRCAIAASIEGLTIPCWSSPVDTASFTSQVRAMTPVRFDRGWAEAISTLAETLEARGVAKPLNGDQGREIALRSYVPEAVVCQSPERVFANVFAVDVPAAIIVCNLERELSDVEVCELRKIWGFVQASARVLCSFHEPPGTLPIAKGRRLPEFAWKYHEEREGKRTFDLVKELISRCLDVICIRAGLVWCADRRKLYFPHGDRPQRNISYRHVDGRNTWVGVTGEKSYGKGERAEPFRYQLAPVFRLGMDEGGAWWATLRLYVRITDCNGIPHIKKAIGKRRKVVTKSWWNKEWFARTLAVIQALAQGQAKVEIGEGHRKLSVAINPLEWECPVSIDTEALERVGDFQEEMAAMRYVEEEDDEDAEEVGRNEDSSTNLGESSE